MMRFTTKKSERARSVPINIFYTSLITLQVKRAKTEPSETVNDKNNR